MDEDEYTPIDGINPYSPGSDAWHKHNLGLDQNSVGQMSVPTIQPDGSVYSEGWYYGPPMPNLSSELSIGYSSKDGFTTGEIVKKE